LRQYPALLNCTTINWFLNWPKEALLEVASTSLDDLDILATITGEQRVNFSIPAMYINWKLSLTVSYYVNNDTNLLQLKYFFYLSLNNVQFNSCPF